MAELADNQEALLLKLKQKGPQTAKRLSELLGITTMGVRQHLAVLEERGFILETEEQKQGRGRPVKPWRLTQKGHQRFPDGHSQISAEIIIAVRDTFGQEGLDKLIDQRTEQSFAQYSAVLDKQRTFVGKLKKLNDLRNAEGYMSEVDKISKGEWLLVENHCPICAAATACQGFCRSELEVFQALFKGLAEVTREEHLLLGARRCVYRVKLLLVS